MNTLGERLKVNVFGQSHSNAIGCTIDGLPAGIKINLDNVYKLMQRRLPGQNSMSTPRKEKDAPQILCGLLKNSNDSEYTTCGAPLTAIINNTNTISSDYDNLKLLPRPSHSDYSAFVKYKGFNDISGGGQFSGRLTAPLCFAGGVALEFLKTKKIIVNARIKSIANIVDNTVWAGDALNPDFPCADEKIALKMKDEIEAARKECDSVGGVIECIIRGVPAGLGEPMFSGVENLISRAIFGIPAVKGIEFGAGFDITKLRGSKANDNFCIKDGKIQTKTNNSGGILGGITSSMPIIFRVAFKPTPSISKPQTSVNLKTLKEEELIIKGRHDPCIVQRAAPVVEAVGALCIADLLLMC